MHGWWLDERAHAGAEHLDDDYVAHYDAKAGYDPSDDVAALATLGLDRDSLVVDLGAGTGVFALAVAPLCRQVIVVDVSPAMTDEVRRRVAEAGVDNVTVVEAGFLSYEHGSEPADFVFTRHALHQLPDFWKGIALDRIAAMLSPRGVLRFRDLVYAFEPSAAGEHLDAWLASATTDPSAGWTADELAAHVRSEFGTYMWILDAMLERTGFQIIDRRVTNALYAAYTCRKRATA
jgi:ubiquinone/menaquinone biosynthesis C-methylase UbiE